MWPFAAGDVFGERSRREPARCLDPQFDYCINHTNDRDAKGSGVFGNSQTSTAASSRTRQYAPSLCLQSAYGPFRIQSRQIIGGLPFTSNEWSVRVRKSRS